MYIWMYTAPSYWRVCSSLHGTANVFFKSVRPSRTLKLHIYKLYLSRILVHTVYNYDGMLCGLACLIHHCTCAYKNDLFVLFFFDHERNTTISVNNLLFQKYYYICFAKLIIVDLYYFIVIICIKKLTKCINKYPLSILNVISIRN